MPPFCPWPECSAHLGPVSGFHRHGHYLRKSDQRRIPRYRCLACERTCSRQTFSYTYYLKRRDLPAELFAGLMAGSAHRQLARSRRCAKTSVTRQADRLARHSILLQARSLEAVCSIDEAVVHDHLETFVGRQDRGLGLGIPVGSKSWFTFGLDPALHKGSGRRPDRLGMLKVSTPGERTYVASIGRSLDLLLSKTPSGQRLVVTCDGRADYRTAVLEHPGRHRVRLVVWPNPKRGPRGSVRSAEARARDAAMFPVDSLHQLIRHTCKDQARETISFGRRMETILGRGFVLAVWRNLVKGRSERKPDRRTPAMLLRVTEHPWSWPEALRQRLFPTREAVPKAWLGFYRGLYRPSARLRGPAHAY